MENEVQVRKTIECDSLSRLSQLTYEFGMRGESEIVMRIAKNSGNGMFCDEWVSTTAVLDILRNPVNQASISSLAFRSLYLGRSVNSPSFLMAALRNEEVVVVHPTQKRGYQVEAVSAFEERVRGLVAGDANVESSVEPKPDPVRKKASGHSDKRKVLGSSE